MPPTKRGGARAGAGRPHGSSPQKLAYPPVTIAFTREQRLWLDAQAERLGCTRPDVVRAAIDRLRGDS